MPDEAAATRTTYCGLQDGKWRITFRFARRVNCDGASEAEHLSLSWPERKSENSMSERLPRTTLLLFGWAALVVGLCVSGTGAQAMPLLSLEKGTEASIMEPARIYRRGRPPIYPYYYYPGHPGGYSFYFGFVPYAPGNIENQALQRGFYPQNTEWPLGLYGGPHPGWGPKAAD
jgi:hypothetical protein